MPAVVLAHRKSIVNGSCGHESNSQWMVLELFSSRGQEPGEVSERSRALAGPWRLVRVGDGLSAGGVHLGWRQKSARHGQGTGQTGLAGEEGSSRGNWL